MQQYEIGECVNCTDISLGAPFFYAIVHALSLASHNVLRTAAQQVPGNAKLDGVFHGR